MYLLITCVGAYNDSGKGSGGMVLLDTNNNKFVIIDYLDSTGLYSYKGLIFRYVRSIKRLISYSNYGVQAVIHLRKALDVHDILITDKEFIIASTGSNEVQFYDHLGSHKKSWSPGGVGDAWHLNCLFKTKDNLFISAFGAFDNHREWKGNTTQNGFLIDIKSQKIISGLSGPHNPKFIDNNWWICNSHRGTVNIYKERKLIHQIQLEGFTRGMCITDNNILIGVSGARNSRENVNAKIISINRKSFKIVKKYKIPFPEIYELVEVPKDFYLSYLEQKEKFDLAKNVDDKIINSFVEQIKQTERILEETEIKFQKTKLNVNKDHLLNRIKKILRGK